MKRYDYTDQEKQICFLHPSGPMTFEARDQEAADVEKEQEEQHAFAKRQGFVLHPRNI